MVGNFSSPECILAPEVRLLTNCNKYQKSFTEEYTFYSRGISQTITTYLLILELVYCTYHTADQKPQICVGVQGLLEEM